MDIMEGSYGGRHGKDGLDAVDTLYANTRNNPIEDIESHYPLRVPRYELAEGSGGRGRWRGGLGSIREIEFTEAGGFSIEGDGIEVRRRPGLFGGGDGHARVGDAEPGPGERARREMLPVEAAGDVSARRPVGRAATAAAGARPVAADALRRPGASEDSGSGSASDVLDGHRPREE